MTSSQSLLATQKESIRSVSLYLVVIALAARVFFMSQASAASTPSMFTDANWVSMGDYPGVGMTDSPPVNGSVNAAAVDATGNVYVGGVFIQAGGASAHYIARWNGSTWTVLGSGMNSNVFALAVS